MFAGLWESWRGPRDDGVRVERIRLFRLLDEGAWHAWLTGEPGGALDILKTAQEPRLTYYPVPKAVGSPKNDAPILVKPEGTGP